MTGYKASDMATASADGYRQGYAAGKAEAAPGIDLEQFRAPLIRDYVQTTLENKRGTVSADEFSNETDLHRKRLALIDASPKGGSTVVTDAMVNAALRVQYARAGSVWTGTEVNPDFVDMRHILTAAMQATSAEVGS